MGLAKDIANQQDNPLPLGEAAEGIYNQVVKNNPELAKRDFSSVYLYLKEAGRKVKVYILRNSLI